MMARCEGESTLPTSGSTEPSKLSWKGHPRLRGGNAPHPHEFNALQMKALAVVCETFVPSIRLHTADGLTNASASASDTVDATARSEEVLAKSSLDDVDAFYATSASDVGLSREVAGHWSRTLKPRVLMVLRVILWALTTSLGTLLLCGTKSLSWRFPFVHAFVDLSPERREKALFSWATSWISAYGLIFKVFKSYSLFCFYAKVDENGQNPCWNAIGYCGADPNASKVESCAPKPLDGKVLDPESSKEELVSLLVDGGFTVLDDISHLRDYSSKAAAAHGKKIGTATGELGIKCDVVVVGSGSGGGVIAGALAKAGYKVLVLEKGGYFARGDLSLLEGPSMAAMYEGAGTLATEEGNVTLLAGATVGGGSAVNWAASLQTPDHVREEWAKDHGLPFFASNKYKEAMDTVCARGSVSLCKDENFQNQILTDGCKKLGYDIGQIPCNVGGDRHSCGWCNLGCKTGQKQATSETWLVDAVEAGALILSNCTVREVLHRENGDNSSRKSDDRRKAVGVVATCGTDLTVYVEAAVTVLSCGSLNTPAVLLRSGLKNPNIGRHLHVHPVIMGWGYFPEGRGPAGNSYEGSIMTAVSKEPANWKSSGFGALLEVPIMHPGTYAALLPWRSGADHKAWMRKYSRTAHFIVLTRDEGSGRIRLDSDRQRTKINYSASPHDQESLLQGLEKGLRALAAAGAEEVGTQHAHGDTFSLKGSDLSSGSNEEFEKFLKGLRKRGLQGLKTPICSAHQMGSCRMGANSQAGVVDASGETWEVEGLFLGDASVFPTASGVNPMITVQSIALCTAQNIVLKLQNGQSVEG